ncbi:hypothetical protein DFJ74DRAFT_692756 [Hyaloraphidium curvatum]|nr:hypothetical protein DFJ74DRAFT_692756 [Hyaloraphidium curvatum]
MAARFRLPCLFLAIVLAFAGAADAARRPPGLRFDAADAWGASLEPAPGGSPATQGAAVGPHENTLVLQDASRRPHRPHRPREPPEVRFGSRWDVLGPLPSTLRGSGDVLAAFTGPIAAYFAARNLSDHFPSEVADGGFASWATVLAERDNVTRVWKASVKMPVNAELLESFYGIAGLEFSAYAATDMIVPQTGLYRFLLTTAPRVFMVGRTTHRFDPYMAQGFVYRFEKGTHPFVVPLAEYGNAVSCAIPPLVLVESPPDLVLVGDVLLPDVVEGRLSSRLFSVTVMPQRPLRARELKAVASINAEHGSQPITTETTIVDPIEALQPFPLKLYVDLPDDVEISTCPGTVLSVTLFLGEAEIAASFPLRCLNYSDAYRFTFEDFDGSVQFAALWSPKVARCPAAGCPLLVSYHGAGVEADSWAWTSSYRRQESAFVLLPTNRRQYGYDWETTGAVNGWTAVKWLGEHLPGLPKRLRGKVKADTNRILYAGHSMGGHGCMIATTHYPDRALAFVPAAGWLRHGNYLPDFLAPDLSHLDHFARGILEGTLGDSDVDLLAGNALGLPALLRVGTVDDNVPSHNLRRFFRILRSLGKAAGTSASVELSEIPGVGHWFDGVVDDDEIQAFFDRILLAAGPGGSPQLPSLPRKFTFTTVNPSTSGSRAGFRVLQTLVTGRAARLQVEIEGDTWFVRTENVGLLNYTRVDGIPAPKRIVIDGVEFHGAEGNFALDRTPGAGSAVWLGTTAPEWTVWQRSPANYGPARQVFETGPVTIVYAASYRERALLMASEMFSRGRWAPVLLEEFKWSPQVAEASNVVLLGGPWENAATAWLDQTIVAAFRNRYAGLSTLVSFNATDRSFSLGSRKFGGAGDGIVALTPLSLGNPSRLALMVSANTPAAMDHIARFIPTFSAARVPDFLVCSSDSSWQGYGSCIAGGYWNWRWGVDVSSAYGI